MDYPEVVILSGASDSRMRVACGVEGSLLHRTMPRAQIGTIFSASQAGILRLRVER
jgi:hypothetical protein